MKTSKSPHLKISRSPKKYSNGAKETFRKSFIKKKAKKQTNERVHVHRDPAKADRMERLPEYVEWIDSKGKKIAQVEKHFAHLNGLLHPVGHTWVIDSQNRMIFQYRSRSMRGYPSHWDSSTGGHIDLGENIHEGAAREAREELGIHAKLHYLGHADFDAHEKNKTGSYHHHERVHFYYTKLKTGDKLKPCEEFEDIAFIPLEKVPVFVRKNKFTQSFLCGWKKYGPGLIKKMGGRK